MTSECWEGRMSYYEAEGYERNKGKHFSLQYGWETMGMGAQRREGGWGTQLKEKHWFGREKTRNRQPHYLSFPLYVLGFREVLHPSEGRLSLSPLFPHVETRSIGSFPLSFLGVGSWKGPDPLTRKQARCEQPHRSTARMRRWDWSCLVAFIDFQVPAVENDRLCTASPNNLDYSSYI